MIRGEHIDGLWAVIPAGGSGSRLWPMSRRHSPKFLHDLTGSGQSLLRATWARLEPLVGEQMLVVTGAAHEKAVRTQLPMLGPDDVITEPSPRDSMAAIGLAAAILELRDPQAVLGSFAADHVITDLDAFRRAVEEAVVLAEAGELVTIGIKPTYPATGFGYIRTGGALNVSAAPNARRVVEFVEKPDAVTAERYLATGEYRWNAGMFVVRATTLLELLGEHHSDMVTALRAIADEPSRMPEIWPTLTRIAIDHAVAEPAAAAGRMAVVPAAIGWDDVGDFASLGGVLHDDTMLDGNPKLRVIGEADDVIAIDASGLVATSGRLVALLGVQDIVVVDTPDALLITTSAHAQQVRQVVERLGSVGHADLT